MGSTRLPGKVLLPIEGTPLLEHILGRLPRLAHKARVVVATSVSAKDDVLARFCREREVECFRGSEGNVLERYFSCARDLGFDQIVRLTADNPFTDIEELDRLIDLQLSGGSDFGHSFGVLPVGVGAEIFTFEAVARTFREGMLPHHLEHVDEYMLEHPEAFKTARLEVPVTKKRPDIRLTVDTEEDYRKACFIMQHASSPHPSTEEVISLCLRYA